MRSTELLAQNLRAVFFGGNWTDSCMEQQLSNVSWQQAITPIAKLNTIATLTYHIGYFVNVQLNVLQGNALEGNDALSFDHPPINAPEDWQALVSKTLKEAETLASLIAKLPDSKLNAPFTDERYGTYYSNFQGLIEHTHYHLGQIVLLKALL